MQLRFLGSGDAFGSGGRFNTCILVDRGHDSFLVDCGASAMISIRRFEVDPNRVGTILLSHLHADHFGGLPFFILDAQLVSRRERPLTIVGPAGLRSRLADLMEASFPGSWNAKRRFPVHVVELEAKARTVIEAGLRVTGHPVRHPSGTPSLALRIECEDKVITYTGDTEWTDELLEAGHAADLLVSEAYFFERTVPFHLDYRTLRRKLPLFGAKRVLLTHMSPDMLDHIGEIEGCEAAHDGLRVEVG